MDANAFIDCLYRCAGTLTGQDSHEFTITALRIYHYLIGSSSITGAAIQEDIDNLSRLLTERIQELGTTRPIYPHDDYRMAVEIEFLEMLDSAREKCSCLRPDSSDFL